MSDQVSAAPRGGRPGQGRRDQALDAGSAALDAQLRPGFGTVRTAVRAIADRLDGRPGGNG